MSYNISRHASERYAQRIMGKNNKTDIAVFINENIKKIETDIQKMIEHGKILYEGKSIVDYNKQSVKIILNGTWVLVLDSKNNTVVTLYSIDLGVGKEFNIQYITKLLQALYEAQEEYNEKVKELEYREKEYKDIISENENTIKEYSTIINSLKEQNVMYQNLIQEIDTNKLVAEENVRSIIATLTGKSIF